MRSLFRILLLLGIVFAVFVLVTQWVLPVRTSVKAVREAPHRAWLTPRELPDHSISQVAGTKLSYFGFEYEIPWSDIDGSKTKLSSGSVLLTLHSGLRLMIGANPPGGWTKAQEGKPESMSNVATKMTGADSDYDLLASIYAFTPGKVHIWSLSPGLHYRETLLLDFKSLTLQPEAENGFFYVGNSEFKGFQEGDPQGSAPNDEPKGKSTVLVKLFSRSGSLSFTLFQKDLASPTEVHQAEINRFIQSVHRTPEDVDKTNISMR